MPGQVDDLEWWLMKFLADDLDIVYMYAEMDNNECTAKQINFQDSPNPSMFITIAIVDRTGQYLTAANKAVRTQKSWVMNEQCQIFAQAVWLGQKRVPPTLLIHAGRCGYNNRASDIP